MSAIDAAPEKLGEWRLVQRLGHGGMGEVWRAERVGPGGIKKRAALKRILPEYQRHAVLRERFLAEVRITARLEHPNVVQVLDFAEVPELYLVLEFVEGCSMADLMRAAANGVGPLAPVAVLYMVAEAATGLDYAHRKTDDDGQPLRIVHRDVSPPNILLSFDGAVKVSDFGIARAADNTLRTQTGLTVGKLVYMAPEQAMGEVLDHRADLFSLGVLLWEALTLKPLLPRMDAAQTLVLLRACNFEAPSAHNPGIPAELDALVLACLARRPEGRPSSAAQLARSLRDLLARWAPTFDERELARTVRSLTAPDSHPSKANLTPARPLPQGLEAEPTHGPAPHTPQLGSALPPRPAAPGPQPLHVDPTPAVEVPGSSPLGPSPVPPWATVGAAGLDVPPTRVVEEGSHKVAVASLGVPPAQSAPYATPPLAPALPAPKAPAALAVAPAASAATPPAKRARWPWVLLAAVLLAALVCTWLLLGTDLLG